MPIQNDSFTSLVAERRPTFAGLLLLIAGLLVVPTGYYAIKAIKSSPRAAKVEAVDLSQPDAKLPELEPVDSNKIDHVLIATASALAALSAAGVGLWFLFSQPSINEMMSQRNARIAILISGTTIGTVAMLLGFALFASWFGSMTDWIEKGDSKQAKWVLGPVLIFLLGAGLVFAAVQPARSEERNDPVLRKFSYGTNLVLTCLLLVFALLVGNLFLSIRLPNKLDTTESGFYSLSEETKKYIASLDQPVKAYTLLSEDMGSLRNPIPADTRRLLAACQEVNPTKFQVKPLNPVLNKEELSALKAKYPQFDLDDVGILITVGEDEKRSSYIRYDDLATSAGEGRGERQTIFQGEGKLVREMLFLTESKTKPVVYFTQGSGELELSPAPQGNNRLAAAPRPATELKALLEKNYVEVKTWTPDLKDTKIPDDGTAVVIADPKSTMTPEGVANIRKYMIEPRADGKKGKLIVLTSPYANATGKGVADTGLEGLLAEFQVKLGKEFLLGRPAQGLSYADVVAVPNPDLVRANNPLAMAYQLEQKPLLLSECREIEPVDAVPGAPPAPFKAEWLFATYPPNRITWIDPDTATNPAQTLALLTQPGNEDLARKMQPTNRGSRLIGAIVSEGPTPRIVVIGCGASFGDASARRQRGVEPPTELVAIALNWLRDRPTVNIANKTYGEYTMSKTADGFRLFWLPFGLILVAVVGLGASVWVIRRK